MTGPAGVRDDGPTWLYRPYDTRGRLLYAGIAADVRRRMDQHQFGPWYAAVGAMTVELYPDRARAAAAEAEAIAAEWPLWNVQHSPWGGVVQDRLRQLDGYWRQDKHGRWHPVPWEFVKAFAARKPGRRAEAAAERQFQAHIAHVNHVRRLTREAISDYWRTPLGEAA